MGKFIAIIGGAGKMGRWLTDFLLKDGYQIAPASVKSYEKMYRIVEGL